MRWTVALAVVAATVSLSLAARADTQVTIERITTAVGGLPKNNTVQRQITNADASLALFTASATNLTDPPAPRFSNLLYEWDETTHRIAITSYDATNNTYSNTSNFSVSGSGRYVAFQGEAFATAAGNGVPGCSTNHCVWFKDRTTGAIVNVGEHRTALTPALSADGGRIAFTAESRPPSATGVPTNGPFQVYEWNRAANTYSAVTVLGADGVPVRTTFSSLPGSVDIGGTTMSDSGRWLLVSVAANNLFNQQGLEVPGSNVAGIMLIDTVEKTAVPVAVDPNTGAPARALSAMMTADGSKVSYTDASGRAWLWDRLTGQRTRSTILPDGSLRDFTAAHPFLAPDGRYMMYAALLQIGSVRYYRRDLAANTTVELPVPLRPGTDAIGTGDTLTPAWDGSALYSYGIEAQLDPTDPDPGSADIYRFQLAPSDSVPPIVSGTPDRPANSAGWYNAPVTVTWSATDPSPSSGTPTTPAPTPASTEAKDVTYTSAASCDPAGNCATGSIQLSIDATKPTVSGSPTSQPLPSGWYGGPVSIHWTCSDGLSGLASDACPQDSVLSSDGANQSVTASVTDLAGNTQSATVSGINIDATKPTISGAPTTQPLPSGWYGGPVSIHWTCSDDLSGLASGACPQDSVLSSDGANQSVTASVTDLAGNTQSATVSGINIDTTAPTIGYSGNAATYTVDQMISITCAASDLLSGLASNTCVNITGAAVDFAVGTNTFTAEAADLANNHASATVSFTVLVTPQGLINLINSLVTNPDVATGLGSKVSAIAASKNANAKANQINAFINQVNAQIGKSIMPDDAATLIRLVGLL